MKYFLNKIFLFSLPVLLLIVLTNYFGDAANIYNRNYEKKIAKILAAGKNVTNISNYDERLLQEEIIFNLKYKPEVVVIGSSRAMQISKDFFPESKFMNSSVSGASLEDLIAIYELYKTTNNLPKKIVLGIDPWTFQVDDKRTRWKSIGKYYYSFKNINETETLLTIDQLISLSYFQNSLPTLYDKLIGKHEPLAVNTSENSNLTKIADGSITYGKQRRNISAKLVEERAQVWTAGGMVERYQNFNSLQPKWNEFRSLIADIKKNNIEIIFVLSPFHPLVYKEMTNQFPIINEEEEKILKFANHSNIPLYGSFNPEKDKLGPREFSDETHPKRTAMQKILLPD